MFLLPVSQQDLVIQWKEKGMFLGLSTQENLEFNVYFPLFFSFMLIHSQLIH